MWQADVKPNVIAVRPATEGSDIVDVDSEWPDNFQTLVLPVSHILRKSTQTCDRELVANQETT